LDKNKIQEALDFLKAPEKNLELIKKSNEIFLINDTYNINYD
jgi:UDP-N-acetylmuramyl pentapeptide synthase